MSDIAEKMNAKRERGSVAYEHLSLEGVYGMKSEAHPAPYLVLNITCPLIVLGTSKSICTSYFDGLSSPSLYSSLSLTTSRLPEHANLLINRSHAAPRHRSGIPLYTRSRSFGSLADRIHHVSTLPPRSRELGCNIRVHLAIRVLSLRGCTRDGKVLRDVAVAATDDGPAAAGERRFVRGAVLRRINRSWEGTEKKP